MKLILAMLASMPMVDLPPLPPVSVFPFRNENLKALSNNFFFFPEKPFRGLGLKKKGSWNDVPDKGGGRQYGSLTHAENNNELKSMNSQKLRVMRDGYAHAGDSASTFFIVSDVGCTLNSGRGDGGSQVPTSDGKCWMAVFSPQGPDVRQFGAVGDGATDDTMAVQNWVNYLSENRKVGIASSGNYKLTSSVQVKPSDYWGWRGSGKYKTAFFYAGINKNLDIFDFGGENSSRANEFSGFSVFSYVKMSGGVAFKLSNFINPVIDDVTFGGELYAKNTWHGIWFNGVHEGEMTRFDVMGQGDGIIVNAGSLGNSSNSDLYLDVGFSNRNGGVGLRQAGGFGGLNVGQVQLLGNQGGQLLIDNSISNKSNRETILSANFVADGVHESLDNIVINSPQSSDANLIVYGTVGSASRYGINVISWPNGYLNVSSGRLYNNQSDAVHILDSTVTFVCGSGVSVDNNRGTSVFSVSGVKVYKYCPSFKNMMDNSPHSGKKE